MKSLRIFILGVAGLLGAHNGFSQLIYGGPDTLCIDNYIQLRTTVTNASSYYWGFCSAYLNNVPTGSSIVAGTGLDAPSATAMAKDGNNYHVFVVNTANPRNLIRYDFGTLLGNVPTAVNLGDFGSTLPVNAKGFELVNTGGNWFGFITGGVTGLNSQLVRLDFGTSLSNVPTVTNLGNMGGLLINPQDLYVFSEAGNWYAFTNNGFTGNLLRINFGSTLTGAPTLTNLGNPGGLAFPTGMWPVFDGTNWHLFLVNRIGSTISRLDFGTSLLGPFVETNLGGFAGALNGPRDIVVIRDCGNYYAYVTNETDNSLTELTFAGNILAAPTATNLGNFAGFNGPRYLTRMLRDRDNVFCFTANNLDNSLSRLTFNSCTASSIPSSTLQTPPPITYTQPGLYNVYFVSDEGLPTMQVDCKQIRVLAKPIIEINNDTLICQRDTILLVANGPNLYSALWSPVYNTIPPFDTTSIRVHPLEDYRYNVHLEFTQGGGCAYDTSVLIRVSKVFADAGPDRFVADGAYTILGGPRMSMGQEYSYVWTPPTYLSSIVKPNPTSRPLDVMAYYVTVTNDSTGCFHSDSVWVRTECTEIHLPNAFNPVSDVAVNRNFGLLNNNVVKLEYFKIFNRWGQVVFETTDTGKKWDGTQNNIELPPDNYVWIIDGYCVNGKRIKKQGTVLLTR